MECYLIGSGMSYSEAHTDYKDKKHEENYNSIRTVYLWNYHTMTIMTDGVKSWNMSIQTWLKYYVFMRIIDRSQNNASMFFPALTTYLSSAYWHGPEPGYACFFGGVAFQELSQRTWQTTTFAAFLRRNLPG